MNHLETYKTIQDPSAKVAYWRANQAAIVTEASTDDSATPSATPNTTPRYNAYLALKRIDPPHATAYWRTHKSEILAECGKS